MPPTERTQPAGDDKQPAVRVTKTTNSIVVEVRGETFTLTHEEARRLHDDLATFFDPLP